MQDHHESLSTDKYNIAVISDGHGNRRHFRSDRGSKIACDVAIRVISSFLDNNNTFDDMDDLLTSLKQEISDEWKKAVREDYKQFPWTEEELAEQLILLSDDDYLRLVDGTTLEIPYGCTLCAVFNSSFGWAAVQVGDGSFALVDSDCTYRWPMPASIYNQGNKTYSLCADDPMLDFRHVYGNDDFVAAMVYSDGIEKVFHDDSKEIMSFIYWLCNSRMKKEDSFDKNLETALHNITTKSPIGDDISIAGIININAENIVPNLSQSQKQNEIDAVYSKLDEVNSTISYNMQRLYSIKFGNEFVATADTIEQIQKVIDRNKEESIRLLTMISEMNKGD